MACNCGCQDAAKAKPNRTFTSAYIDPADWKAGGGIPVRHMDFITKTLQQKHQSIGPFKPVQIVPTAEDIDLLTNPAGPEQGAGSGDLIYHGGRTIVGGRLVNVYLGSMGFDTADFDNFTKAICQNGYYMSPDQRDTSPTTFVGSVKVAYPFTSTVSDVTIQQWVNSQIGRALPADDGSTMYSLIFPAGTTVTFDGMASCSSFCGYHQKSSLGHYYQVINDSSCGGCHGSFQPNEGRMMIQAHEYSEWRSDPDGNAWYDSSGYENADKCAWQKVAWGPAGSGWVVQPQWVNGKGCYTGAYNGGPPPVPQPLPVKDALVAMLNDGRYVVHDTNLRNIVGQRVCYVTLHDGNLPNPPIWVAVDDR